MLHSFDLPLIKNMNKAWVRGEACRRRNNLLSHLVLVPLASALWGKLFYNEMSRTTKSDSSRAFLSPCSSSYFQSTKLVRRLCPPRALKGLLE